MNEKRINPETGKIEQWQLIAQDCADDFFECGNCGHQQEADFAEMEVAYAKLAAEIKAKLAIKKNRQAQAKRQARKRQATKVKKANEAYQQETGFNKPIPK